MAHPAYYNKKGKRLPSVTTVISGSLGWNKEVLMRWAWRQGTEGKEFRETVQQACDAGTMAHAMVEEYVNKRNWKKPLKRNSDEEVQELATRSFKAFKRFERSSGLEYVATETSLVSETWQYGGTLDAVATMEEENREGKLERLYTLLDWKTSNSTYADHLIQLAAYKTLWEEHYPDKPLKGGIILCRFSKANGMVTTHNYPDGVLEPAWVAFSHLRALHAQKWEIDSMTK